MPLGAAIALDQGEQDGHRTDAGDGRPPQRAEQASGESTDVAAAKCGPEGREDHRNRQDDQCDDLHEVDVEGIKLGPDQPLVLAVAGGDDQRVAEFLQQLGPVGFATPGLTLFGPGQQHVAQLFGDVGSLVGRQIVAHRG